MFEQRDMFLPDPGHREMDKVFMWSWNKLENMVQDIEESKQKAPHEDIQDYEY